MAAGLKWVRSSRSGGGVNNCVEVAGFGASRAVRDSKDADGPRHVFSTAAWTAFVAGVKRGEFDLA